MSDESSGQAKQIAIERDGINVKFVVRCSSEYDAMMLYDRLTDAMQNGYVNFEIMTKKKESPATSSLKPNARLPGSLLITHKPRG